ncbi:hypothetical protein [Marinobacter sp. SS5-14b]|uniref:hypothetical protein n=1 Tax=Marinobacter sp. SS5-14b TaxID=3050456 RepID=UPI0026E0B8E8|nr:hypothetical protein [Marinobacter sp. SS5-14b]
MSKYFNTLTNTRARLFDAEAILHFLNNRDNLNALLEEGSADVLLGAMINQAWDLVANAGGDCQELVEARDEDLRAEIVEMAVFAQNLGRRNDGEKES